MLELRDVEVAYRGFKAVTRVSLALGPGERWAVIGPNGAGKTTLFKAISGEVALSQGTMSFRGRDIAGLPPHRRARLGIGRTYQVNNLFPRLTVNESILVSLLAGGRERWRSWWPLPVRSHQRDRVLEVVEMVGLAGRLDATTSELSHGEQRQLEIALAVASEPQLLLLDEPAAGLTTVERLSLTNLIANLPRDISLMIIEHDIEMALGLVDQVLCMDNGVPLAVGTPEEIRADEAVQAVYLRGAEC
jgi:branched-chain amino acid transport system ATP-binding protein